MSQAPSHTSSSGGGGGASELRQRLARLTANLRSDPVTSKLFSGSSSSSPTGAAGASVASPQSLYSSPAKHSIENDGTVSFFSPNNPHNNSSSSQLASTLAPSASSSSPQSPPSPARRGNANAAATNVSGGGGRPASIASLSVDALKNVTATNNNREEGRQTETRLVNNNSSDNNQPQRGGPKPKTAPRPQSASVQNIVAKYLKARNVRLQSEYAAEHPQLQHQPGSRTKSSTATGGKGGGDERSPDPVKPGFGQRLRNATSNIKTSKQKQQEEEAEEENKRKKKNSGIIILDDHSPPPPSTESDLKKNQTNPFFGSTSGSAGSASLTHAGSGEFSSQSFALESGNTSFFLPASSSSSAAAAAAAGSGRRQYHHGRSGVYHPATPAAGGASIVPTVPNQPPVTIRLAQDRSIRLVSAMSWRHSHSRLDALVLSVVHGIAHEAPTKDET